MIKLIIFDWDDVFTSGSKEGYFACYHQTLLTLGIQLDPDEEKRRIIKQWGRTHIEELRELLKEHPKLLEKASHIYEENLFGDTYVDCLKLVSGSVELLNRLKDKYILALATGVHPKVLKERVMPKFGIPNVFSHIVSAYELDADKTKPHPFSVEEIMRKENVSREETVVVGDAGNDVQMALSAGVTPIVVLTGHLNRKGAEELGVKYIVNDVTKIEKVIGKIDKTI